jgi:hypothetical protein
MTKYLICYINNLLMVCTYNYCFRKTKSNVSNLDVRQIIVILIISFFVFLSNVINSVFIKCIFLIFIYNFLYYINVEKNFGKSLFYTLVIYIFNFIFDFIYFIVLDILNIKFNIIGISDIYKYIFSLFSCLILIIIFERKKIINFLNILYIRTNKSRTNFYILLIFIFLYSLSGYLLYLFYENKNSFLTIWVIFSFCGILCFFLEYTLASKENIEKQNNRLLELNDFYGKILEQDKVYKHNIKNKFLTIKSIGDNNIKNLVNEYLNEEPTSARETNDLYNVPNSIKGIICEKLYHFKWTKIIVVNNLKIDPYIDINIKVYKNLCEIIGISLDNATEATENIKNGFIYLNFNEEKENYILEIINNFSGFIDLEKLGKKYYSTKNRNSGFGVYSVLKCKDITTNYKYTLRCK